MAEETIWKLDIQEGNSITVLKNLDAILLSVKAKLDTTASQSSKFANAFTASTSSVKSFTTAATDASEGTAKLTTLQTRAGEVAKKLEVAQAQAALALKRASETAASGTASAEQIALAQAKATLAAERVKVAQDNVTVATAKVAMESARLAEATNAGTASTDRFSQVLSMLRTGLSTVSSGISETAERMVSLGRNAISAGGNVISGFQSAARSVIDFTSKIGMAVFGIQQISQSVVSFGNFLLGSNASMEQTSVAFKQLLGSSSAANAELKDLQAFAAATPFEFPDLANSVQQLLAFQIPLKDTKPLLTAIGDALSGLGRNTPATLDQVVRVFGQMNSSAHLMTGDVMQLTDVGINGFQILADQMHKPVDVIRSDLSKGLIDSHKGIELLRAGMEKTFGGGMQAQSLTFNGLISTFQDNIMAAWRSFTGPLFEQAKAGLIKLGDLVSSPAFQQFAGVMSQKVGDAIKVVAGFIEGKVIPAFSHLLDYFRSKDFKTFIDNMTYLGTQIAETVTPAFNNLKPAAKAVFDNIGPTLKTTVTDIGNFAHGVGDVVRWFREGGTPAQVLKDLLVGIGVAIAAIQIGAFLATLPALIVGFIGWATTAGAAAIATIALTWPILAIGAGIALVVAGIILAIQHWGDITKWLKDRWHEIQVFFGGLWQNITHVFGVIGKWFGDRFNEARTAIVSVFGVIGKWFGDRFNEISAPLRPLIAYIGAVFQTLWNIIVALFKIVGKYFSDRFNEAKSAIVGVFSFLGHWAYDRWQEVASAFGIVGKYFSDRFNEAKRHITEIFAPIGKLFSDRWNDIVSGVVAFKDMMVDKFNGIKTIVVSVFLSLINGIIDQLNNGISAVENFINFFGQGLDNIATALGTKGTIPVAHLSRIPHYAEGTTSHPGGPAILGERGRELVMLPRGASVLPNAPTEQLLSLFGGIPGYASGTGNPLGDLYSWLAGGAKSVIDNLMSALHISVPDLGPMKEIATGIVNKIKDWAVGFVENLLPHFGGGGASVDVPGNVASWIAEAMQATGTAATFASALATIAMHESGGNPNAINLTDSNAKAGHPSQGLFQTIPSTFAAYALAGHGNILNPVDNAIAAIRYMIARYGSISNVPGIVSLMSGGNYVGYANGGLINETIVGIGASGRRYLFGERGQERVLPASQMPSDPAILNVLTQILAVLQRGTGNTSNINVAGATAKSVYDLIQSQQGWLFEQAQRGAV